MKRNVFVLKKSFLLCTVMVVILLMLSSCHSLLTRPGYFADKDNYIADSGIITYIGYDKERQVLAFDFDELTYPRTSENYFYLRGENVSILEDNGFIDKIEIGSRIEFTAPRGLESPIVAISMDGEEYLDFETGYKNWMRYFIRHPL